LLENTFDRKRISANPSSNPTNPNPNSNSSNPNPNFNPYPKAQ